MHALTDSSQVGVNCRPDPQTALSKALADGKLQVQQWDTLQDKQDKKRDHKSTWGHTKLNLDKWKDKRDADLVYCNHM